MVAVGRVGRPECLGPAVPAGTAAPTPAGPVVWVVAVVRVGGVVGCMGGAGSVVGVGALIWLPAAAGLVGMVGPRWCGGSAVPVGLVVWVAGRVGVGAGAGCSTVRAGPAVLVGMAGRAGPPVVAVVAVVGQG